MYNNQLGLVRVLQKMVVKKSHISIKILSCMSRMSLIHVFFWGGGAVYSQEFLPTFETIPEGASVPKVEKVSLNPLNCMTFLHYEND